MTAATGHCLDRLNPLNILYILPFYSIHGICAKMDGTVVMVDRGDHKVKEFKEELDEVRVLAGSGRSGTKDGGETTAFPNQLLFVVKKVPTRFMYWVMASIDLK